jgi:hypothetical protein
MLASTSTAQSRCVLEQAAHGPPWNIEVLESILQLAGARFARASSEVRRFAQLARAARLVAGSDPASLRTKGAAALATKLAEVDAKWAECSKPVTADFMAAGAAASTPVRMKLGPWTQHLPPSKEKQVLTCARACGEAGEVRRKEGEPT